MSTVNVHDDNNPSVDLYFNNTVNSRTFENTEDVSWLMENEFEGNYLEIFQKLRNVLFYGA